MTLTVVVYGAGSIGNHLTHAARTRGLAVRVVDPDPSARSRMREEIYPARYGGWDEQIELWAPEEAGGAADLVVVGTPPDVHLEVASAALERHAPRALLVEKPLCRPRVDELARFDELTARARARGCRLLVGYNHRVAPSVRRLAALLREAALGPLVALDVDFREHWEGIFAAHPWLAGPTDSYLGHGARGGGASGEHSHALDLFVHLVAEASLGEVARVQVTLDEAAGATWDRQCHLVLHTTGGLCGRVAQDVVTRPPVKRVSAQGERGGAVLRLSATVDDLAWRVDGHEHVERFEKSRPDDFLAEIDEIVGLLDRDAPSPLDYAACRDAARLHLACGLAAGGRGYDGPLPAPEGA